MVLLKNIIVTVAGVLLLASGALGQNTSRTFHLTTVSTLAGMNELATIIRTLDANAIFADKTSQTLTVRGTDAELALAAWLIEQLDSEHPQSASPQYTVAGSAQDAVRIFYLVNTPTQAGCTPAGCDFLDGLFFLYYSYGYNSRKIEIWPLLLLPMSRPRFANSPRS